MPVLKKVNELPEVSVFKMRADGRFPKKIGSIADLYYETRQRRLEIDKVAKELKAQETWLKNFVIDEVPKSNTTGIAGSIARVQVIPKSRPQVNNWDDFYKYMLRTKRPELLQKRLSTEAVVELWDDKKTVPGVEEFLYKDVSLTKL